MPCNCCLNTAVVLGSELLTTVGNVAVHLSPQAKPSGAWGTSENGRRKDTAV